MIKVVATVRHDGLFTRTLQLLLLDQKLLQVQREEGH